VSRKWSISLRCPLTQATGLEWHPIHPNILTSGDSAGAIIYWSLLSPNPSEPMTTLSNAHDDAVFSLSFHPLGHLLCSGSKDFSARFWSRARPVGGQEIDRWHLGEEKAIEARMEEEREKLQQIRKAREDQSAAAAGPAPGLPGLPGLSNFRNENGSASNAQMPSGGGSLPGFGGLPGFGNSNSSAMPPRNGPPPPGPPSRSWGSDPMSAGGMRANGPLPLQSEMRKFGAPGYGDDRGPPGGGGYNRGGPPAQGNGYGDRDRYGGAPSQGYGPPAGEYGRAPLPPGREHVSMPAGRENYGPPVGAYGRDPRDQQRGYGNQQGGYQNNQGGGGGGGGWR
jgi:polyadenylation factor subunit 2